LGDAKCKYFLYSIARKIGPCDFWNSAGFPPAILNRVRMDISWMTDFGP
jgi:hypothetical protein